MTSHDDRSSETPALRRFHERFVAPRRIQVLAEALAPLVPHAASVLDIGCGDGGIAALMKRLRPDISVGGVELRLRPECRIDAEIFDGRKLPFPDASRDVCMFVDVLHHAVDAEDLLREACRVSRRLVLIKDHLCRNGLDRMVLSLMDWFGNSTYGVRLTHRYFGDEEWRRMFHSCGVTVTAWHDRVPMYAFPADLMFGRQLHFVAKLEKGAGPAAKGQGQR